MIAFIVFSILILLVVNLSFSIFVCVTNTLSARPRDAYYTIHSYSEASSEEFVLSLCASCNNKFDSEDNNLTRCDNYAEGKVNCVTIRISIRNALIA